ncbi:MAG: hypothetical protein ACOC80_09675 [Petrotogales bacterium]
MVNIQDDEEYYKSGPDAVKKLNHCINHIKESDDFNNELEFNSKVVQFVTLEEMIGAMLHARDKINELKKEVRFCRESNEELKSKLDQMRQKWEKHDINPNL